MLPLLAKHQIIVENKKINMIMNKLLAIIVFVVTYTNLFCQDNNAILLTIGDKQITKGEFERIYRKNSNVENADQKSVEDYLELFINFKLKVIEAEKLGLDTSRSFKNELSGYRKQLAKPYLTDKNADEKILREAYERMLLDLRASHILIKIEEGSDTVLAYNKALKIRKRLLAGEDFEKIAKEVSDDPSAASNGGDLGYFTVFQMVYPFESAAYKLNIGEISNPVKTQFGYHILKLTDKRNAKGQIKVAHIMRAIPKNATQETIDEIKKEIFDISTKIKSGEDFVELAKTHSDDKGSAVQGGILPWFGTGRMVPEFETAAYGIENIGDVSEPVQTSFGWHIIKLIDRKSIGTFEEVQADLKTKVLKDSRSDYSRKTLIAELKTEYKFTENRNDFAMVKKIVDESIFEGKWQAPDTKNMSKIIFSFADKKYTQADFVNRLATAQKKTKVIPLNDFINQQFEAYIEDELLDYEEGILEKKHDDFRYLMNEYHDGILLFELTDKTVWTKAVKDTAGLDKFHNENKMNYMWDARVDASMYTCVNSEIAAKVRKLAEARLKKGYTADEMAAKFVKISQNRDTLKVDLEDKVYNKGDNKIIDSVEWTVGLKPDVKKDDKIVVVSINKLIPPTPKTLQEAKGLVTADYQTYLEKEWIKSLRDKYSFNVNKEVLSTIK